MKCLERAAWLKSEKIVIFLLLLLTAAVRITFLLNFETLTGDASSYVIQALEIFDDPSILCNFSNISSTLFQYALAVWIYVWNDHVIAPRFFSLIFGVLLILPFYGTVKIIFNPRIAFFSCIILIFYPLQVIQSCAPSSDAAYYFFIFCCLYYFFKYKSDHLVQNLYLSAFLFNIAAVLRFESWVFIPIFFLFLSFKNFKVAFVFLILTMILPGLFLLINQMQQHDLLYTFNMSGRTSMKSILEGGLTYDSRLLSWFFLLCKSTGNALTIVGCVGIFSSIILRRHFQLAIFFIVLFIALTTNSVLLRMVHHERYSILLGILLIPYAIFFVNEVVLFFRIKHKLMLLFFVILPMFDFGFVAFNATLTMPTILQLITPDMKQVSHWLKGNVAYNEKFILDNDHFDALGASIFLYSGLLPRQCCILNNFSAEDYKIENKEKFPIFLWSMKPTYLLLNTSSHLQRVLKFNLGRKKFYVWGITFEFLRYQDMNAFGQYLIYRLSY
ncbi:MAG: glycosyltransferase family 39 protein [Candidatus Omnitrophota bacterium]